MEFEDTVFVLQVKVDNFAKGIDAQLLDLLRLNNNERRNTSEYTGWTGRGPERHGKIRDQP